MTRIPVTLPVFLSIRCFVGNAICALLRYLALWAPEELDFISYLQILASIVKVRIVKTNTVNSKEEVFICWE